MTRPVVLIAEELAPSVLAVLGDGFDIRSVDGADRGQLLPALADADAVLIRSATRIDDEALAARFLAELPAAERTARDLVELAPLRETGHLLLMRSVGQIAEARPDLIDPSSTAREISALPALPAKAAHAFATIAERVERSLFALRSLSAEDWHAARAA